MKQYLCIGGIAMIIFMMIGLIWSCEEGNVDVFYAWTCGVAVVFFIGCILAGYWTLHFEKETKRLVLEETERADVSGQQADLARLQTKLNVQEKRRRFLYELLFKESWNLGTPEQRNDIQVANLVRYNSLMDEFVKIIREDCLNKEIVTE